ncbi:MAG TPA: ABC transporter substrate-binding protein, partial [Bifidobacterium pullorum]|nr:ABC transporter substrate-binding protein [Bifidobacterium pullorum]
AGTVPDVIQMGTTWMADFADAFAPVPENFDLSDFSDGPLEAGWKFIQWMTEPETQIEWYKTATVLPSSQSAWEDEVLAGDEKLAAYGKQLESTQAPPAVPTWAQVSAAGDRIMEQIYKGQLTVDEGLKNLQAEAESIGTGE